MPKFSVLIIEDEKNIQTFMGKVLKRHDYQVLYADTGKQGLEMIRSRCPDLILLDLGLPDMDGCSIIRDVRTWASTPIIVISARTAEREKVAALDLGADDYISKPFSIREVMVRIRAVLRRTAEQNGSADEPKVIGYQGLVLDLDRKTVSIDGEAVPFTKTEFELLHLLLEEKGRVFSRQELIDRVWPKDVMVLDRTVDVNITRMRKKVGRFAKCIVTRLGFGYYFDA